MSRSQEIRYAAVALAAVLLGSGFFLWGDKHGLETTVITGVTPDQIANAMKQDAFYSNYRRSTLLIEATTASVTEGAGATTVQLATTSSLTVFCNLGQARATTHAGEAVTVVAPGAAAQRQPAGVLLQSCAIAH